MTKLERDRIIKDFEAARQTVRNACTWTYLPSPAFRACLCAGKALNTALYSLAGIAPEEAPKV